MKILLLEDDVRLVDLIRFSYTNEEITSFDSLNAGLKWLGQNRADLLIVDLGLTDSHGLETLKALNHVRVPKVVMTGSIKLAKKTAEFGASDFIPKQGDMEEVLERIGFNIEKYRPKARTRFAPDVFEQIKACLITPRELTVVH